MEPMTESGAPDLKARYLMIGGFLGAGKTTAVARLARQLEARGLRVGLITNDQSSGLVDTSILRSHGHAVEEIAGGCFCCRFNSLSEAAQRLEQSARPDIFIAEPVGSCTDLVATVSYPLRRIYGERFCIAPLSVLVDPERAARVLGLSSGRSFSEKVVYVYEKQLEEADLIVVNKCDRIDEQARTSLVARLRERFPRAQVLCCSALVADSTGEEGWRSGFDRWLELLLDGQSDYGPTMDVDYQVYAEGEALLGWLNATIAVSCTQLLDANALLVELGEQLRAVLDERQVEIAHLKMTLEAGGQLAAMSITGSDQSVDLREALVAGISTGELLLNLRAEADPELLRELSEAVLRRAEEGHEGLTLEIEDSESFRPAPPEPTHRITSAEAARLKRAQS